MSEKGRRAPQTNFIDDFENYLETSGTLSDTKDRYRKIFGILVRECVNKTSSQDLEKLCFRSGYQYGDLFGTVINHLKKCEEETRVGEFDYKHPERSETLRQSISVEPHSNS
jgi:hypothetical protein